LGTTTILLVSSRTEFRKNLSSLLAEAQLRIDQDESWALAQGKLAQQPPQLLLIDNPGAGVEGLALCSEIRNRYGGLLVLLSGDDDARTLALALDLGVDAAFSGTIATELLVAQLKALLRRFASSAAPAVRDFGSLRVDDGRREVFIAERPARFSTMEFNLFWLLVNRAGTVVSRDEIHQELYSSAYNGYDRGIDICISRIRQKIGDDPLAPCYLKTVRGVGYQFCSDGTWDAQRPLQSVTSG